MENLQGRIAVVTGAARGIGLAIAEALVAEDVRVLMTDIDRESVEREAERLRAQSADVAALRVDVSRADDVDAAARAVVDRWGGLHIAVNNAGIVLQGRTWELSLDDWHRVVDIDLWGAIHGVRAFVPAILATGAEGHVVNVASMTAVLEHASIGPYVVSKHGVLGLSDVLRSELAEIDAAVSVSVVMPGMVDTALNPFGTLPPAIVAANVVDAIKRQRAYVFTDDHHTAEVEARLGAILAARSEVVG